MLVTKSTLSHICQLNRTLRTRVHEPITALWMELCSSYDFGQLLHISWFDVDNVEALILNIQVPQVYAKIVTADECLTITVH